MEHRLLGLMSKWGTKQFSREAFRDEWRVYRPAHDSFRDVDLIALSNSKGLLVKAAGTHSEFSEHT